MRKLNTTFLKNCPVCLAQMFTESINSNKNVYVLQNSNFNYIYIMFNISKMFHDTKKIEFMLLIFVVFIFHLINTSVFIWLANNILFIFY